MYHVYLHVGRYWVSPQNTIHTYIYICMYMNVLQYVDLKDRYIYRAGVETLLCLFHAYMYLT